MASESDILTSLGSGIQTVVPQLAMTSPQVVYLDFDGAATSYVNTDLGVAIDNVTVEDSGISESDIGVSFNVISPPSILRKSSTSLMMPSRYCPDELIFIR